MQLSLNILSKNKKSLGIFIKVFKIFFEKKQFKTKFKTKKLKRITLLKSPHVHKKAQEHFETKTYRQSFFINLLNIKKFLLLFKKFIRSSFYDLRIIINFFSNKETGQNGLLQLKSVHLNFYSSFYTTFSD